MKRFLRALLITLPIAGCADLIGADFDDKTVKTSNGGAAGSAASAGSGTTSVAGSAAGGSAGSPAGGNAGSGGTGTSQCEPGKFQWVNLLGVKDGNFSRDGRAIAHPDGGALIIGRAQGSALTSDKPAIPLPKPEVYYLEHIGTDGTLKDLRIFDPDGAIVVDGMALQPASPQSVLFWGTTVNSATLSHFGDTPIQLPGKSASFLLSVPVAELFSTAPTVKSTAAYYDNDGPPLIGGVTAAPDGRVLASLAITAITHEWFHSVTPRDNFGLRGLWLTAGNRDLDQLLSEPYCNDVPVDRWKPGAVGFYADDRFLVSGNLNGDLCSGAALKTDQPRLVVMDYTLSSNISFKKGDQMNHHADSVAGMAIEGSKVWLASTAGATVHVDRFDPDSDVAISGPSMTGEGITLAKAIAVIDGGPVFAADFDVSFKGGPITLQGYFEDSAVVARFKGDGTLAWPPLALGELGNHINVDGVTVDKEKDRIIVSGRFNQIPLDFAGFVDTPVEPMSYYAFAAGICP